LVPTGSFCTKKPNVTQSSSKSFSEALGTLRHAKIARWRDGTIVTIVTKAKAGEAFDCAMNRRRFGLSTAGELQ
jgi:hypothetical protein